MELIAAARILRRQWILVAVGLAAAILLAVTMLRAAHSRELAEASQGVLLSTPDATVLNLTSDIADTMPDRATLLADLMMGDSARAQVARAADVAPAELAIRGPAMGITQVATALPVAAEALSAPVAAYAVDVATQDPTAGSGVPLISVTVTGANPVLAARIASATATVMKRLTQGKARSPGVIAHLLGSPSVQTVSAPTAKRRTILPVAASILLFCLWCSAIVVASGIRRGMRRRRWTRSVRAGSQRSGRAGSEPTPVTDAARARASQPA